MHKTAISHYTHSPQELKLHSCRTIDTTSVTPCCTDMGDVKSAYCLQEFLAPNPTPPLFEMMAISGKRISF